MFFKIFRDFQTFLRSSGTHPGVQKRSFGATFAKNILKKNWFEKCLGGSRMVPGVHPDPLQKYAFIRKVHFFLHVILIAYLISYLISY